MEQSTNQPFRCGSVAIVGRPNVGKSTLLNALIDASLSIVTPRAHTTRQRILGVANPEGGQILYLDTPGLHRGAKRAINRSLNRAVHAAIAEADVAVQVVAAERWDEEDAVVYAALAERAIPRLLAVNKVDRVADKAKLLPFVEGLARDRVWEEVFMISAQKRTGLAELERAILSRLPANGSWRPSWSANSCCASWARNCRTRPRSKSNGSRIAPTASPPSRP
jgi:GTP-binding protein Era